MSAEAKDNEAAKLIDEFAEKLLALTGGKKIPKVWKDRLKAAISTTRPQKPGDKIDPSKVARTVELLLLNSALVRRPRSKHHNPAVHKDAIADEVGYSRKTVERIDEVLVEMGWDCPTPASMTEDKRKAIVAGFCNALESRLDRADDEEHRARVKKVQAQ